MDGPLSFYSGFTDCVRRLGVVLFSESVFETIIQKTFLVDGV